MRPEAESWDLNPGLRNSPRCLPCCLPPCAVGNRTRQKGCSSPWHDWPRGGEGEWENPGLGVAAAAWSGASPGAPTPQSDLAPFTCSEPRRPHPPTGVSPPYQETVPLVAGQLGSAGGAAGPACFVTSLRLLQSASSRHLGLGHG